MTVCSKFEIRPMQHLYFQQHPGPGISEEGFGISEQQRWIMPLSFHHAEKNLLVSWDCCKCWSIRFHFCSNTLAFSINYSNPGYYCSFSTCLHSCKTITSATSCHNELQGPITPYLTVVFPPLKLGFAAVQFQTIFLLLCSAIRV